MPSMYKVQSPRLIYSRPRPKTVLILALALLAAYLVLFRTPAGYHVVRFHHGSEEISTMTDEEREKEKEKEEKEKHEQELRDEFAQEYEAAKK